MSLYKSIQDSLEGIVKNGLVDYPTAPVIYSHSDGTKPNNTFITIDILYIDQAGMTEQSGRLSEVGDIEYFTPYTMLVNFAIAGKNAGNVGMSLYQRLKNSALNRKLCQLSNLSILDKSSFTKNNYPDGNKWIEYFNFTARFYFISHFTETVNAVESIVVEDVTNSLTFTIPPT
jgi:hypothetical protein